LTGFAAIIECSRARSVDRRPARPVSLPTGTLVERISAKTMSESESSKTPDRISAENETPSPTRRPPPEAPMSEMESRLMPGGKRQFEDAESAVADHEAPPPLNEGERLSMALRVNAVEARLAELAHAQSEIQAPPPTTPQSLPAPSRHEAEPQKIPARMLNEFVY